MQPIVVSRPFTFFFALERTRQRGLKMAIKAIIALLGLLFALSVVSPSVELLAVSLAFLVFVGLFGVGVLIHNKGVGMAPVLHEGEQFMGMLGDVQCSFSYVPSNSAWVKNPRIVKLCPLNAETTSFRVRVGDKTCEVTVALTLVYRFDPKHPRHIALTLENLKAILHHPMLVVFEGEKGASAALKANWPETERRLNREFEATDISYWGLTASVKILSIEAES